MRYEWHRKGRPQGGWLTVQDMAEDLVLGRFELEPGDHARLDGVVQSVQRGWCCGAANCLVRYGRSKTYLTTTHSRVTLKNRITNRRTDT
jgi:hypothetical protein